MSHYRPQPIPESVDPALAQYLADELEALKTTVNAKVDRAYGCLRGDDFPQITLGTTPVLYPNFDTPGPPTPAGVNPDPATDSLTMLEQGIYLVFLVIGFIPQNARNYKVELYVNGAPSGISQTVRSASTVDEHWVNLIVLPFEKGDVLTLFYNTVTLSGNFEAQHSAFGVFRVSDTFDKR